MIGYYDYSFLIYGLLRDARVDCLTVGGARRDRYRSIEWPAANCCCLPLRWDITAGYMTDINIFGDKILDLQNDFRKFSTVAMLWFLIGILRASLVEIDMEMAEKYVKQQQPAISTRYVVWSHWKICRRMCVSINGPGDLEL